MTPDAIITGQRLHQRLRMPPSALANTQRLGAGRDQLQRLHQRSQKAAAGSPEFASAPLRLGAGRDRHLSVATSEPLRYRGGVARGVVMNTYFDQGGTYVLCDLALIFVGAPCLSRWGGASATSWRISLRKLTRSLGASERCLQNHLPRPCALGPGPWPQDVAPDEITI